MRGNFELRNFDLSNIIKTMLSRAGNFDSEKASSTNLVDPFAAALESALSGYESKEEWLLAEHQRTRQKNLMNHVGDFQQAIIGELEGWTSYPTGSDMPDVVGVRGNQQFLLEVKNKHNTMNSSSAAETYDRLRKFLERSEFRGFTAGVVAVISPVQKPYFKPFAPSNKPSRNDIVWFPGRVFYAFATDPSFRVPFATADPLDDLDQWVSWPAIDCMLDEFLHEIEIQTGYKCPDWIKELSFQALGRS